MDISIVRKRQYDYLYGILKAIILFLTWLYMYVALLNFFFPMKPLISQVILFLVAVTVFLTFKKVELDVFRNRNSSSSMKRFMILILCFLSALWILIVIFRPTMDTDANVYHLPLSILMNHSVWYPGIVKLSTHFGFPNGNSVLASVFTSSGIIGFENIPNLFLWITLGIGVYIYLIKKGLSLFLSFFVPFVFLLTPVIFWQSYNMGTDLPSACFLLFGLLAFSDKKLEDSMLFFSLASVFKPLGMVAFLLTAAYIVFLRVSGRKKVDLLKPKIVLSFVLFFVYLVRMFIGTGNPFYPVLPLNFASWGISPAVQRELLSASIRFYSGVERTLLGTFVFTKDFFLFPNRVGSSYWFIPFFLVCFILSSYVFIKHRQYKKVDIHYGYLSFLIVCLAIIWFIGSPLFRFIAGLLIFINIKSFISLYRFRVGKLHMLIVYTFLFITLGAYIYNTGEHIKDDVVPLIHPSSEARESKLPFDKKIFSTIETEDGFTYSVSDSTFCGRVKPPCINLYSIGDKDELIKEYRKYNRL